MWPWEHVAFAYVLYSLGRHARLRSPTGGAVVVLAFGSVLPDLIDKPLSWSLDLFPQGYSIGHSIFVAPFVLVTVAVLAARLRHERLGVAFGVGYLSHLAGDVIYPVLEGDGLAPGTVLWPVVELPAYDVERGFVERILVYAVRHAHRVTELQFSPLVAFELGLFLAVLALWLYDGAPVLRESIRAVARRIDG